MTLPNEQMVQHIANLLGLTIDKVHHKFPAAQTIISIDISFPCCHIPIPNTLPAYPGTKLMNYSDPSFPNSPTSSPEPLPIPPPYKMMTCASPFNDCHMAVMLYDKLAAQEALINARDADAERQTPSLTGPQPGVHPGPGWIENWTEINTHHYFAIPNGEEDKIASFICYDITGPFPELLATNGCNCRSEEHTSELQSP